MAGDPCRPPARPCAHKSFNPRPPSMAGDPRLVRDGYQLRLVSIRARHRWRAIQRPGPAPASYCAGFNPRPPSMAGDPRVHPTFCVDVSVSIRARHRWRAILADAKFSAACDAVSIRARHRWRAIPPMFCSSSATLPFQSAPAIDGGRSSSKPASSFPRGSFQSAPAIDGGRSFTWQGLGNRYVIVSIRARHRWRAIQASDDQARQAVGCFNPRPPSMAGDPTPSGRPFWQHSSFNPRPPSMAGDPSAASPARPGCRRFNPRPPSMAGDPEELRRYG